MNNEVARLQTFYHYTHISPINKCKLVKKGCHAQQNEEQILINCFKCEEVFDLDTTQIPDILDHPCVIGDDENIPIKSPYDGIVDDKVENDLNYEEFRLGTFCNWPHDSICDTTNLAKAGFYFVKSVELDRVKCYYCSFSLCKWKVGADPLKAHETFRPTCKIAKTQKQILVKNFLRSLHREYIQLHNGTLPEIEITAYESTPDEQVDESLGDIEEASSSSKETENTLHITNMNDFLKSHLFRQAENMDFSKAAIINVATARLEGGKPFNDLNDLVTSVLDYRNTYDMISTELNTIKEKYNRLKDEKECKICFANTISVVFNPCRHMLTCSECATKLNKCPYCQQNISAKISILFP